VYFSLTDDLRAATFVNQLEVWLEVWLAIRVPPAILLSA